MASIRVGVQVQPQQADFDGMRRAWLEAEELGVDSIFCWDHFFPLYGDADGKHFEAIATLGALAQVKDRLGKLNPQPLGKLPILIGGSGPKVTLKLVAQYGDMWHGFGDAQTYKAKNE